MNNVIHAKLHELRDISHALQDVVKNAKT